MQCNQPFYGNSFINGPFCSTFNTPIHPNQGIYPEIVGEGQVSSVTLPDGSVQFFFMPTLKWWSPNSNQCQPFQSIPNPMFGNTNYNIPPPYNYNGGTWFIRSISNSFPQSACNPPSQRNEIPRLAINNGCNRNLNNHDLGYQVKFHNDGGTSTTDLVYFYPSLRQRDFVLMPSCKDKTVQIDAGSNNTVCHYQVVCSKPCNCSVPCAKPMSLETLVGPNLTSQSNEPCSCSVGAKPMSLETPVDPNLTPKCSKPCSCSVGAKPMSLETPVDPNLTPKCSKPCSCSVGAKPMSLETSVDPNVCPKSNKSVNFSAGAKPMSLESLVDRNSTRKSNSTSTEDSSYCKEYNKRSKTKKKSKIICGCYSEDKKKKRNRKKNISFGCGSTPTTNIVCVDKSVTTYADEGVSCNCADGRETQTSRTEESQCDCVAEPMNAPPSTSKWMGKCYSSDSSTCDERSCDDISNKKRAKGGKYKRSKLNKCDCGCYNCNCDSSVDCGSASEVETVASKDKGEETPFTCSTWSIKTVLGNSNGSPIKIARKASIGKVNSSLQWLTSDNVFRKRVVKEVKIATPPVSHSSETEKVMDEKYCTE